MSYLPVAALRFGAWNAVYNLPRLTRVSYRCLGAFT